MLRKPCKEVSENPDNPAVEKWLVVGNLTSQRALFNLLRRGLQQPVKVVIWEYRQIRLQAT